MNTCHVPLSIVIPVRNRQSELRRLLSSVAWQAGALPGLEVIVVENDSPCNQEWLLSCRWPFRLCYEFVPDGAAARNRNVGAAVARGKQLFFVDSDVELSDGCLQELAVPTAPELVVMADVLPRTDRRLSLASHLYDVPAYFRRSFRARFRTELSFRHFVSCAFTVDRERFIAIGGFDEGFVHYGYEDVEFGWRAESIGTRFRLGNARVTHHKRLNPDALLSRSTELGRSAVYFVERHPEIEQWMPLGVADSLDGTLRFDDRYDVGPLLKRGNQVERTLIRLRRNPALREAIAMVNEGKDVYRQLCLYGRYRGIVGELACN